MKVVGRIGGELVSIEGRLRDSGWALIMPETPEGAAGGANTPPPISPLGNMMRWVTGGCNYLETPPRRRSAVVEA